MGRINHEAAVTPLERYALLDLDRRELKGELRLRSEAARFLEAKSVRGLPDRVLAGTGDLLISLGQNMKKRTRLGSPAAV